jgi:hypothetical protein
MPRKYSSLLWITGLVCLFACTQKIDDFRGFLNNEEIKYPGAIAKVFTRPGNGRLGVGWSPSSDPSVTKYRIYWNNFRDSLEVASSSHSPGDTVFTVIDNLQEYTYSLFVYSLDAKGNRSIPVEIQNARVYGNTYRNSLMNRYVNSADPYEFLDDAGNEITLNFLVPDSTNAVTHLRYINTADEVKEVSLLPGDNSVTLPDYKYGTKVAYQSEYTPTTNALDTFLVNQVDTFPDIAFTIAKADKGLFQVVSLPNDVGPWEGGTSVARLWDGSSGPQGWPNIWHSNGDRQLPHHFTFDMGKAYRRLRNIEITGRDCCHNPVEFEIWGIEDITNAATTLPGNDPGWKDEALAKGWILLQDVNLNNNGVGPYTLDFAAGVPKIRYIRFRVKRVASGENAYSNLSEITVEYRR